MNPLSLLDTFPRIGNLFQHNLSFYKTGDKRNMKLKEFLLSFWAEKHKVAFTKSGDLIYTYQNAKLQGDTFILGSEMRNAIALDFFVWQNNR